MRFANGSGTRTHVYYGKGLYCIVSACTYMGSGLRFELHRLMRQADRGVQGYAVHFGMSATNYCFAGKAE